MELSLDSLTGKWVVAAAVLGSGMASLDMTVVNIALPAIGQDLNASFAGLQRVVSAYTLTLASVILLGGSLGDRFGRRRTSSLVRSGLRTPPPCVLCRRRSNS